MHVATFIKFGEKEHMESLLKEGLFYLNTLEYFRKIEDDHTRGDIYEGACEILRGTEGEGTITTLDGEELKVGLENWNLRLFPDDDPYFNIFSIFTLTPDNYPITDKVLEFGEWAFVVRIPDEFIARLSKHLAFEGISASADKVNYVSDDHAGKISPFQKTNKYKWQSEWRLRLDGGSNKPRIIKIGDLSDIAIICKASEVNSRFKVTKPEKTIK